MNEIEKIRSLVAKVEEVLFQAFFPDTDRESYRPASAMVAYVDAAKTVERNGTFKAPVCVTVVTNGTYDTVPDDDKLSFEEDIFRKGLISNLKKQGITDWEVPQEAWGKFIVPEKEGATSRVQTFEIWIPCMCGDDCCK